jgi:hypothetical protein
MLILLESIELGNLAVKYARCFHTSQTSPSPLKGSASVLHFHAVDMSASPPPGFIEDRVSVLYRQIMFVKN